MAPHNDDLREIMAQCRVERQALFGPVSEISRRLQPRHLVDVTTRYARDKVAEAVSGVSDAIKENGGTAATVALGAVAVFDAGRRSVDSSKPPTNPNGFPWASEAQGPGEASVPRVQPSRQAVTNAARTKMLAGSVGGLLIGHVIGRSFDATETERKLFGKASGEVQEVASEFVNQHLHGAKLVAAQAFGFARYSAAFLAIMATVSDFFGRSEGSSDPPIQ
ncbi:hypothetical protein [Mesorhizobium sangaii]|uniref:Nutrient deprivation-induced protein n=1 Tax=Mesorhizobium sangaii TaxID=505389 RepID=A0A841PIV0_9HYPH|nr:hypothetical protein [Mesorhizobium sangaii]MBB6410670.1 hypothetical protein [Mesorhizobium sangaii]